MVEPVLRVHRPDICKQVRLAVFELRVRFTGAKQRRVWRIPNDEDVIGLFPTSLQGDVAVRVVGGDDNIGEREREPLQGARQPVQQAWRAAETRDIELGNEVVDPIDDPVGMLPGPRLVRREPVPREVGELPHLEGS